MRPAYLKCVCESVTFRQQADTLSFRNPCKRFIPNAALVAPPLSPTFQKKNKKSQERRCGRSKFCAVRVIVSQRVCAVVASYVFPPSSKLLHLGRISKWVLCSLGAFLCECQCVTPEIRGYLCGLLEKICTARTVQAHWRGFKPANVLPKQILSLPPACPV